jgi:hypothetical protein
MNKLNNIGNKHDNLKKGNDFKKYREDGFSLDHLRKLSKRNKIVT